MRALRGVIVLVLALALSAPVLAANFWAGLEASNSGDYATALEEWRPLAEQGDPLAQRALVILRYGLTADSTGRTLSVRHKPPSRCGWLDRGNGEAWLPRGYPRGNDQTIRTPEGGPAKKAGFILCA